MVTRTSARIYTGIEIPPKQEISYLSRVDVACSENRTRRPSGYAGGAGAPTIICWFVIGTKPAGPRVDPKGNTALKVDTAHTLQPSRSWG